MREKVSPYEFESAGRLMEYFWEQVEKLIAGEKR